MDSSRKRGVEALGESFGEGQLLGQVVAPAGGQDLEELVEPVAEIGPLPQSLEVPEERVDLSLEVL